MNQSIAVGTGIKEDVVKRFTAIRSRRELAQQRLIAAKTRVETARDNYNNTMAEMRKFGVGSYQELEKKIEELRKSIMADLETLEQELNTLEAQERETVS